MWRWLDEATTAARLVSDWPELWLPGALALVATVGWIRSSWRSFQCRPRASSRSSARGSPRRGLGPGTPWRAWPRPSLWCSPRSAW